MFSTMMWVAELCTTSDSLSMSLRETVLCTTSDSLSVLLRDCTVYHQQLTERVVERLYCVPPETH